MACLSPQPAPACTPLTSSIDRRRCTAAPPRMIKHADIFVVDVVVVVRCALIINEKAVLAPSSIITLHEHAPYITHSHCAI